MNHSNKKPPLGLVLLCIVVLGILLFFVTDGKLDLNSMSKTRGAPTDKEENMAYNDLFRSVSNNTLERDGIILRADGNELLFYALAGKAATSDGSELKEDLLYTLTSIAERSDRDIEQISEYMGYFYMYDGEDVYRIHTTNSELKLTIDNCTKFEPMGNYLYSIKDRDGEFWLHRCMVTGADEEYMFRESFVDFWAHSGDLLLKRPDGSYMWYDVVTENSYDRSLPSDASGICLYESTVYFLHSEEDETYLYQSPCFSNDWDKFIEEPVADYCIAEGYCAYFAPDKSGTKLMCLNLETGQTTEYSGMHFDEDSTVDVSKNNIFITDSQNRIWYSPLNKDNWKEIFVD
ncbi:MAG: hypothetical protein J6J04_02860 [Oscillospiraceae bacterium]|nr:hypothetical protein [Oscillospiraceae bacterium]